MADVVLEVRDLVKHFPVRAGLLVKHEVGSVQAVDGVSFTLQRGRTLGLVGESGSGKSTLARLLVGVERPSAGQVLLEGEDVSSMDRAARRVLRRKVQMIFQDPYTSLNPRMSVGEIVGEAFALHPESAPRGRREQAVAELLDLVGLNPDHVSRYPHQFSGGQRQRIGIARALAVRPSVLVCDEPVSALDVSVQGQVINLLRRLQRELGVSYLFIAHDLAVVRHIAHDVAVMYLGRVVESGPRGQVYTEPRHPYTRALMSAVPLPDPARRSERAEIVLEGDVPSPSDPPSGCRFHTRCWWAPTRGADGELPASCRDVDPPLTGPVDLGLPAPGPRPGQAPASHLSACHFPLGGPDPAVPVASRAARP
ncbi:ABC transporter ATP-binding protein [Auraticoccus monumenti]|uniref:Peptide/nickel transport system ATP-binding protein n=1 Tax=Auraticoccus monumenti TaxID=675864 RepID=A0A1G6V3U1_9ACTN|nr:oligopeptide/dipeptide ABC transporter ATP-binding protein [Auraticoccus monumenti]SDD48131.1 peptide/nickel transport system ATP-binding protein [Auraticoccus monumenti]